MSTPTEPTPRPRGRPALPPGEGRTARLEWRTTDALKARAEAAALAADVSVSVWIDQQVMRALRRAERVSG